MEQFILDNERDIVRLSQAAAARLTGLPASFLAEHNEEYLNEMRLRVWKNFDPSRAKLSTFLFCIGPRWLRQQHERAVRIASHELMPDPEAFRVMREGPGYTSEEYERVEERIDAPSRARWVRAVVATLEGREAEVCRAYLEGAEGQTEVGQRMGVSRQNVEYLHTKIRKAFAAAAVPA